MCKTVRINNLSFEKRGNVRGILVIRSGMLLEHIRKKLVILSKTYQTANPITSKFLNSMIVQ